MRSSPEIFTAIRLTLRAETAADLMTANPISLREDALLSEAVAFLTAKGFSAAPVIDEAGRPVGMLSRSDIVIHDCERSSATDDPNCVRDIMTPVVYCVPIDAPAARVVKELVDLKVHRVFVVDSDRVLVGVVSAVDVLRRLAP